MSSDRIRPEHSYGQNVLANHNAACMDVLLLRSNDSGQNVIIAKKKNVEDKRLDQPSDTDNRQLEQPSVTDNKQLEQPSVTENKHLQQPPVTDNKQLEQPSVTHKQLEQPSAIDTKQMEQISVTDNKQLQQPPVTDKPLCLKKGCESCLECQDRDKIQTPSLEYQDRNKMQTQPLDMTFSTLQTAAERSVNSEGGCVKSSSVVYSRDMIQTQPVDMSFSTLLEATPKSVIKDVAPMESLLAVDAQEENMPERSDKAGNMLLNNVQDMGSELHSACTVNNQVVETVDKGLVKKTGKVLAALERVEGKQDVEHEEQSRKSIDMFESTSHQGLLSPPYSHVLLSEDNHGTEADLPDHQAGASPISVEHEMPCKLAEKPSKRFKSLFNNLNGFQAELNKPAKTSPKSLVMANNEVQFKDRFNIQDMATRLRELQQVLKKSQNTVSDSDGDQTQQPDNTSIPQITGCRKRKLSLQDDSENGFTLPNNGEDIICVSVGTKNTANVSLNVSPEEGNQNELAIKKCRTFMPTPSSYKHQNPKRYKTGGSARGQTKGNSERLQKYDTSGIASGTKSKVKLNSRGQKTNKAEPKKLSDEEKVLSLQSIELTDISKDNLHVNNMIQKEGEEHVGKHMASRRLKKQRLFTKCEQKEVSQSNYGQRKKYPCKYCSKLFSRPYVYRHQKEHPKYDVLKGGFCSYCSTYYHKPYLYHHQRLHKRKIETGKDIGSDWVKGSRSAALKDWRSRSNFSLARQKRSRSLPSSLINRGKQTHSRRKVNNATFPQQPSSEGRNRSSSKGMSSKADIKPTAKFQNILLTKHASLGLITPSKKCQKTVSASALINSAIARSKRKTQLLPSKACIAGKHEVDSTTRTAEKSENNTTKNSTRSTRARSRASKVLTAKLIKASSKPRLTAFLTAITPVASYVTTSKVGEDKEKKEDVRQVMDNATENIIKYQCPKCNFVSRWWHLYQIHSSVHKGLKEAYVCQPCGISFKSPFSCKVWHRKNNVSHVLHAPDLNPAPYISVKDSKITNVNIDNESAHSESSVKDAANDSGINLVNDPIDECCSPSKDMNAISKDNDYWKQSGLGKKPASVECLHVLNEKESELKGEFFISGHQDPKTDHEVETFVVGEKIDNGHIEIGLDSDDHLSTVQASNNFSKRDLLESGQPLKCSGLDEEMVGKAVKAHHSGKSKRNACCNKNVCLYPVVDRLKNRAGEIILVQLDDGAVEMYEGVNSHGQYRKSPMEGVSSGDNSLGSLTLSDLSSASTELATVLGESSTSPLDMCHKTGSGDSATTYTVKTIRKEKTKDAKRRGRSVISVTRENVKEVKKLIVEEAAKERKFQQELDLVLPGFKQICLQDTGEMCLPNEVDVTLKDKIEVGLQDTVPTGFKEAEKIPSVMKEKSYKDLQDEVLDKRQEVGSDDGSQAMIANDVESRFCPEQSKNSAGNIEVTKQQQDIDLKRNGAVQGTEQDQDGESGNETDSDSKTVTKSWVLSIIDVLGKDQSSKSSNVRSQTAGGSGSSQWDGTGDSALTSTDENNNIGDGRRDGDDNDENNNQRRNSGDGSDLENRDVEFLLCLVCKTSFSRKADLMRHLTKVHLLTNLCQFCYFTEQQVQRFANPVSLRNHKLRKHAELMVKCVCGTLLIDEKMLSFHQNKFKCHMKASSGEETVNMVKCVCGKRFCSLDLLQGHKSKCRKRPLTEVCNNDCCVNEAKAEQEKCKDMVESRSYKDEEANKTGVLIKKGQDELGREQRESFSKDGVAYTDNLSTTSEDRLKMKGRRLMKRWVTDGRKECSMCVQVYKPQHVFAHQKLIHQRKRLTFSPPPLIQSSYGSSRRLNYRCRWCRFVAVHWKVMVKHHYSSHTEEVKVVTMETLPGLVQTLKQSFVRQQRVWPRDKQ